MTKKRFLGAAILIVGAVLIGAIIFIVVRSVREPSGGWTIAALLSTSLGAPIALALTAFGWSLVRNIEDQRRAAERRADEAFSNALTAEELKQSIEAFVEIRVRRAELAAAQEELTERITRILIDHASISSRAKMLGEEVAELSPDFVTALDGYVERPPPMWLPRVALLGLDTEAAVNAAWRWFEGKRSERLVATVDRDDAASEA